ncbi:hypothetical protein [Streptomyces sp. NPDC001530]|uniref:hypothetical protein n=1 Tax=Streptomyces sp. NPDC001530 TaxID=3364582 RepID=UPI00367F0B50
MGIESDQLVFDYLSRVGDLAQQRQLPSATRMRLVSELRNEIDRRRAKATVDSPAAVRRILSRLGTPEEIVAAAGGDAGPGTEPWAAVPTQRTTEAEPRPKGLRRVVPKPRPAEPEPSENADAPSPPHLASAHELGDSAAQPDWWRGDSSPFGLDDSVPGFVGGVEIPELLKRPPEDRPDEGGKPPKEAFPDEEPKPRPKAERKAGRRAGSKADPEAEATAAPEAGAETARPPRRRLLSSPSGWSNPLLLIAAALLVAGAVLGNWFALGLGWLIAYASRRLTPAESKWAVFVLPGLAATAGIVWLWGRTNGRWGDPIAKGHMNDALLETWPWVVRGAAVASALYLVWRSQRQR